MTNQGEIKRVVAKTAFPSLFCNFMENRFRQLAGCSRRRYLGAIVAPVSESRQPSPLNYAMGSKTGALDIPHQILFEVFAVPTLNACRRIFPPLKVSGPFFRISRLSSPFAKAEFNEIPKA